MSVRVVARIRPLLDSELDKDIIVRPDSTEEGRPYTIVKIPSPKNGAEEFSFAFNGVYDQSATQETLFTSEGNRDKCVSSATSLLTRHNRSCSSPQVPVQRPRCHNLRIRRHRNWKDAHNARRTEAC